jgi:hypothetical protein
MAKITRKKGQNAFAQLKIELDAISVRNKQLGFLAKKAINQPTFFKWEL